MSLLFLANFLFVPWHPLPQQSGRFSPWVPPQISSRLLVVNTVSEFLQSHSHDLLIHLIEYEVVKRGMCASILAADSGVEFEASRKYIRLGHLARTLC